MLNAIISVIGIVIMFVLISKLSVCQGYQNLWLFVLVVLVTIPVNIHWVKCMLILCEVVFELGLLARVCIAPIAYCCILGVEEILLGIVGRLVWRFQYELHFVK